jgi:hypothetical protein
LAQKQGEKWDGTEAVPPQENERIPRSKSSDPG